MTNILIITYVNDFLIISSHNNEIKKLKIELKEQFTIKELGPV